MMVGSATAAYAYYPQAARAATAAAPQNAAPAAEWFAAQSAPAPVAPAALEGSSGMSIEEARARARIEDGVFKENCRTCAQRTYQDGSDDSSVSFQTPQHIDPGNSAAVVASHEQEHVVNERANAELSGGKVVMQSVVLHGDICPECGCFYISGGTTTTTTKTGGDQASANAQQAQAAALVGGAQKAG